MKNLFTSVVLVGLANLSIAQAYQTNWANEIASTSETSSSVAVAVDNNGNIFELGQFSGNTNFDPSRTNESATPVGQSDIYLRKLDAEGNLIWVETYGSANHDTPNSLTIDADGNALISGSFESTMSFTNSASTTSNHF